MVAEESPTRRRRRFATVRLRTTLLAVAVVGVVLVVAAAGLVLALRRAMTESVETAAELRADDIASALTSHERPDVTVAEPEAAVVQVVDDSGRVVLASDQIVSDTPIVDARPGTSRKHEVAIRDDGAVERERFLVVARAAATSDGPVVVLVGRTLEDVTSSTRTMTKYLALGLPILLAIVGFITWLVVGRALAPVERMRTEVTEISARELHRRVPEPGTDDEIGRLGRTLNEMLDRLERAQAQQRQFVSDASHELRSPLTTIHHLAEVASTHPEGTDTAQLAEDVLTESHRLEALVDDLLWMASADEGTLPMRRTLVDLDDLVLAEARHLGETTAMRVDTRAVSAGQVVGDPSQLRRLVRNLTDNAARHAVSTIALSLDERDSEVVLYVDDDGAGISSADRTRVFDRFVRLDEARARESGGSGLGLAITARIVEAHHGQVEIGDAPLGGARLEVHLPRGT
jgi:signal transduction histidine kinase